MKKAIIQEKFSTRTRIIIFSSISIILVSSLIFFMFISSSKVSTYSYGESGFTIPSDSQAMERFDLVYSGSTRESKVTAIRNRDDIEAFMCEGYYIWDKIPPDTCEVVNQSESDIEIYTYRNRLMGDSLSELETKYSFTAGEYGYYLSKTESRQSCAPGRGWSFSLSPFRCS